MNIKMMLNLEPFLMIKNKEKHIEVRCNDEKRKLIKIGDTITFENMSNPSESIVVEVLDLYRCESFKELYSMFDFKEFGCAGYTMEKMIKETREIYSEEREKREGVLGIRVKSIG